VLLADTTAFITGAARGIGLEVARRFAEQGAAVALADIDPGALEAAVSALIDSGVDPARVATAVVDVTDPESVEAAADTAEAALGPISCVVPNAGILHLAPTLDFDLGHWRRVIDVNLTGAFITAQVLGRRLRDRKAEGSIIFTASLFAVRGGADNAAYSASKFGMLGLMECLAAELAPLGITVNAVCPGQIQTAMIDQLSIDRAAQYGTTPEAVLDTLRSTIPMARLGQPSEVADTYVFLASSLARYTTGQALVVDGGIRVG
jgi:sorbitol-6-phosphate 2-dehydrogenase/meso-butanediol dehydrogenase/(S,S)-butanediol dehydrogenase/diacetyl reductase